MVVDTFGWFLVICGPNQDDLRQVSFTLDPILWMLFKTHKTVSHMHKVEV